MTYQLQKGDLVAVAMSGGVDSSVTAALMMEAGYQVIGITLQLYDHGQMVNKKGACCAGQDIYDARTVADRLGFPHYVFDYESIFKQSVIDQFVDSYIQGETPLPCVQCNQKVKFRDLLTSAKQLGAKALMTGHYVQRVETEQGVELHRGSDEKKDQSYFLFATTKEQLDYLRFPVGGFSKEETRQHAKRFGLSVADKPDSQDICFVPSGGYAKVVEKIRPGALDPGKIVDLSGKILGDHQGIINYTIGQRRGLGIASEAPLYVVKILPKENLVVVGPKEALAESSILLRDVNWLTHDLSEIENLELSVKIRSSHVPVAAHIQSLEDKKALVTFKNPEYGIARGQACVFYQGNRVLGGGWITQSPEV